MTAVCAGSNPAWAAHIIINIGEYIVKSIYIYKRNGDTIVYSGEEYTSYEYNKKCFIVIKEYQWIGIHNMKDISDIIIR